MANKSGMTMKGDKALMRALDEMPKRVGGAIARKVMRAAGGPIVKGYRQNIKRHVKSTKGQVGQRIIQSKGTASETISRVGAIAGRGGFGRLAHLIERGTVERVQKKTGRRTGRMPAFAPLRRAWDANIGRAQAALRKKLGEEIEKAARKLGRKK